MRLEGATLQSIADRFEVSLEWVRQVIPPIDGKTWSKYGIRSRCVYPGICQWLFDNRCTYAKLAELIGAPQASVSRWMNGIYKPNKDIIDKILKVTGLTYEQAFREEESTQTDEAEGLG